MAAILPVGSGVPRKAIPEKVIDGRPGYAKPSIDGGKQVENAAIDPDFDRDRSLCP
jgi:hypothetical protein